MSTRAAITASRGVGHNFAVLLARAAYAGLRSLMLRSVRAAAREQELTDLVARLESIVPDLRHQYSLAETEGALALAMVRSLHAFQISLATQAIREQTRSGTSVTVVDIGDSAGTHLRYLQELLSDVDLSCLGVNLDVAAVERIRSRGIDAMACRAEDLTDRNVNADVFLSFETLEHLTDPIRTLRNLSYKTNCRSLVVTVPYVPRSRVGLYHIRAGFQRRVSAEDTHIFEFSPADWRLMLVHAGWRICTERTYLQYPRRGALRALRPAWEATEKLGMHAGFWGAILSRDHTWSDLYSDW